MIARLHHQAADPVHLALQLGWTPSHEPSIDDLLLAAKHLGLKAKRTRSTVERLNLSPLPALALLKSEDGTPRIVILAQCDGQRVLFQDPSGGMQGGRPVIEPLTEFERQWSGELILITSRASLVGALAKFDFSWFIPSLVKYRKLLGEVLLVSLFLQIFALVSPLFFQVVMDKVLVHRGTTTLDVLVIGLIVVVLFESVLTVPRSYVFSHTTSRIDVAFDQATLSDLKNAKLWLDAAIGANGGVTKTQALIIWDAIGRIDTIRKDVKRLTKIGSGDEKGQPVKVKDSDVGQENLDYQMAVLTVGASTDAVSLIGGLVRTHHGRVYTAGSFANQIDEIGAAKKAAWRIAA